MGPLLSGTLTTILANYPVDRSRIIAAGFSGGGMAAHYLSMAYPNLISAIVINTGMISESYQNSEKYLHAQNQVAVFLASPTDFRYHEMQADKNHLEGFGWRTQWIEFEGGHAIAPESAYMEAAEWIEKELAYRR